MKFQEDKKVDMSKKWISKKRQFQAIIVLVMFNIILYLNTHGSYEEPEKHAQAPILPNVHFNHSDLDFRHLMQQRSSEIKAKCNSTSNKWDIKFKEFVYQASFRYKF